MIYYPQPTYYIPHGGGPCFFMEDPHDIWTQTGNFLYEFSNLLPQRPKAILVISSHWENTPLLINSHPHPSLYYDYYDFPEHTYHLKYAAPGDPLLANKIQNLLAMQHIPAYLETKRGWDHGVFVPLKLIFPNADVPVVELSLHANLDPDYHLYIGQALTSLRNENILILGSGMSYHNLPALFSGEGRKEAFAFDQWLTTTITHSVAIERNKLLSQWLKAPGARSSHPRPEHLLPLFVAAGAANNERGYCIFKDHCLQKPLSAFQFGQSQ